MSARSTVRLPYGIVEQWWLNDLECLDEKEAQSAEPLCDAVRSQLSLAEQIRLVLANVPRAQLVRGAVEVAGEILDRADVAACGTRRVISTLEFLEHHFA